MTQDPSTEANIRRARTLNGFPPEVYQTPYLSLPELLAARVRATPDKDFLTYYNDDTGEHTVYRYNEFATRVAQMAALLVYEYGIRRGDRVATLAHNHADGVFITFACWFIGATVAPQNVAEDDAQIAYILQNAQARLLFVGHDYLGRVERIRANAPVVQHVVPLDADLTAAVDRQPTTFTPPEPPGPEDECLLVYTSGTTGRPKGVQLTHYNLLINAQAGCVWHNIQAHYRVMCVLPIHHVNGIVVTLVTPLYAGASVVLNRGFKAATFWRRLAEERIQFVSMVPTLLQFLLEADEDISRYDLSGFHHLLCGAGTLPMTLAERFERRFGARIIHGYGLSETTAYACQMPVGLSEDEYRHWQLDYGYPSIGVPIGCNEMAIHDPEGREVPDGEKGEIVIRGHNVMRGYFQRPEANAEAFKYGWFRSGDEGFVRRDNQGRPFFFITGRIKELINRGGMKYSPFEIEEVLTTIPGVRVGLAIAFDNVYYGEEVGAYIISHDGVTLTEAEVLAACRERMPFAKAPKVVVFGDIAPVTSTGKYQRLLLKDKFKPWEGVQFRERGSS